MRNTPVIRQNAALMQTTRSSVLALCTAKDKCPRWHKMPRDNKNRPLAIVGGNTGEEVRMGGRHFRDMPSPGKAAQPVPNRPQALQS
jgi:hypothetical protein